jgi:NAD(P)-dependent dehydrogenase (short-subunit alcohol dehydrogenase family)
LPTADARTALITGATGGIGVATVTRLAAEGFGLWITDLNEDRCSELAEQVRANGGRAWPLALDVCSEADWEAGVQRMRAESGGLQILVNNAGIGNPPATVTNEPLADYEKVVGVTQTGVFLGMKHAGALIEHSGGGSIINICSILGTVGGFGGSFSYHAAKGAVRTMTKNAAVYWAERGVRVNSVHPGFIATPRLEEAWDGTPRGDAMLAGTPMRRRGKPEEVAGVIAFLAGPDSSYMTGSELYVDGGWTAI